MPEFTAKVIDNTLEVTVKNQPIIPYENGSYPNLFYMFRFKDNDTRVGQWFYDPTYYVLPYTFGGYHKVSDSDFTTVSLPLEEKQFPSGQIDIQTTSLFGNQYPTSIENGTVYAFDGHYSGWSNPQYITMIESNTSPSPTLTPPTDRNPPHLEPIDYLIPVSVIVVIFIVLSVLLYGRHRKTSDLKQ